MNDILLIVLLIVLLYLVLGCVFALIHAHVTDRLYWCKRHQLETKFLYLSEYEKVNSDRKRYFKWNTVIFTLNLLNLAYYILLPKLKTPEVELWEAFCRQRREAEKMPIQEATKNVPPGRYISAVFTDHDTYLSAVTEYMASALHDAVPYLKQFHQSEDDLAHIYALFRLFAEKDLLPQQKARSRDLFQIFCYTEDLQEFSDYDDFLRTASSAQHSLEKSLLMVSDIKDLGIEDYVGLFCLTVQDSLNADLEFQSALKSFVLRFLSGVDYLQSFYATAK